MKKTLVSIVSGIIMSAILISFNQTAFSADKYKIKFGSSYPPKHPTVKMGITPWTKEVTKQTNGKLNIKVYPPNALFNNDDALEALEKGVADMTFGAHGLTPDRFPLGMVLGLPFLFSSASAGGLTGWELAQQYPEFRNEYKDFKLLWMHGSGVFQLHTKNKRVRTLEDIQGLKIIIWVSESRPVLEALGANPVEVSAYDSYLALERGMADGVLCPIAPMRSFKITDVTKHHTLLNSGVNGFFGGLSWKMWNKLPTDLQNQLDNMGGKPLSERLSGTLDKGDQMGLKWMRENGHHIYRVSETEMEKMRSRVQHMYDAWQKQAEKAGHKNAAQILQAAMKYSKDIQAELDAR